MKKDFTMSAEQRRKVIISHLQEKPSVTRRVLSHVCGSSLKTIQRDIEKLRDDQWPIESHNEGYFLRRPSKAERRGNHNKVIATLLLTGGSIDRRFSQFAPEVAMQIKNKFLKMDDLDLRAWDVERGVTEVETKAFSEEDLEMFGKLARFILNQQPVRFYYKSILSDEGAYREAYPVQLKERDGHWYMLCYDYDREGCRVFAVSRISKVGVSNQMHQAPDEETIASVMARGSFSIWDKPSAQCRCVRVKLYDYAARLIQERVIHHSQKLEVISADEVILTMKTGDLLGINLWLRQFAPMVEILEPSSLKEDFIRDLRSALVRNE